ncbi:hypothetical protein B0T22DRAFT_273295 [Podospora appendiculata]|uniref:F-box domain-containing protein n=1 Tax=Podospora appendiculata TaxID=314037 RepID=A0AAE1C9N9_9PEZI|nr:hypothetical protein B0T22DRAFT_273295 [Podospora appendiculata]
MRTANMSCKVSTRTGVVPSVELQDLPIETVVDILSYLDVESLAATFRTNSWFCRLVRANWVHILLPIIKRDFSPIGPLFRVFDLCGGKPAMALQVVRDGAFLLEDPLVGSENYWDDFAQEKDRANEEEWRARLYAHDFLAVFKFCITVKQWEREFNRLRFFQQPQQSRVLEAHEFERFRHALYAWWTYARYFHGGVYPSSDGESEEAASFWLRLVDRWDARCNFMRQFSTSQLMEMLDMWTTIKAAVGRKVCPSASDLRLPEYNLTPAEAASIGWGESGESILIRDTMMKLTPDEILHLLVSRHRYTTKRSLVQFILLKNPGIERSVETFSSAWDMVMDDREGLLFEEKGDTALDPGNYFPASRVYPMAYGGVLDYATPEAEGVRAEFSQDGGRGLPYCVDDERFRYRNVTWRLPRGRLMPHPRPLEGRL